ncbi:MAG: biopolymer transporter ExbD [Pirellulales bacterium]|nr:biopolymer transporter ExbD [Pirellulales bacterium]
MRIRNTGRRSESVELMMTPMIDIVFQLLIFFILTFKIVLPEGDFNVKMPRGAPARGNPLEPTIPMKVKMTANDAGQLTGVYLEQVKMPANDPFGALRARILQVVGANTGPDSKAANQELELDCDPNLHYRYVIDAISAASGKVMPDGQIVKLIEKIKFTPPPQH